MRVVGKVKRQRGRKGNEIMWDVGLGKATRTFGAGSSATMGTLQTESSDTPPVPRGAVTHLYG